MATVAPTPRFTVITLSSEQQGPFEVGFRIFSTDLRLFIDDEISDAFTVDAAFANGYSDGATFTLDEPAASGTVLRIETALPAGRGSDYLPSDPGLVRKLNIEQARQWSLMGDQARDIARAPKVPPSAGIADPALPTPESGVSLIGRADGAGWESGPTADQIADAQFYASLLQQPLMIFIEEDDIGVLTAIGHLAIVSESDTPYPSILLEVM